MKISITLIVKNESRYIRECLDALCKQQYNEFEIIIVDNGSRDGTGAIVNAFKDSRIKYWYEPQNCGMAALRNLALSKTTGEYIFFTDGDCVVHKDWISEGLKVLQKEDAVGVEGQTYYEFREKITIRDGVTSQFEPGGYLTCNIAYKRSVLE